MAQLELGAYDPLAWLRRPADLAGVAGGAGQRHGPQPGLRADRPRGRRAGDGDREAGLTLGREAVDLGRAGALGPGARPPEAPRARGGREADGPGGRELPPAGAAGSPPDASAELVRRSAPPRGPGQGTAGGRAARVPLDRRRHRRRAPPAAGAGGRNCPPPDAEIVKFTNNAVVRLPAPARCCGSPDRARSAAAFRSCSPPPAGCEALGLPAVRAAPGVPQPLEAAGHVVTVWRAVERALRRPPPGLAGILRAGTRSTPRRRASCPHRTSRVHRSPAREAPGVPEADLAFLARGAGRRRGPGSRGLADVEPLVPPASSTGTPSSATSSLRPPGPLCATSTASASAPREWDLIPVAVGGCASTTAAGLQEAIRARPTASTSQAGPGSRRWAGCASSSS